MNLKIAAKPAAQNGSILIYFLFTLVVLGSIAQVSSYVVQNARLGHRRLDMQAAQQFAEGGATLAAGEFAKAYTNKASTLKSNLLNNATGAYTLNSTLGNSTNPVF